MKDLNIKSTNLRSKHLKRLIFLFVFISLMMIISGISKTTTIREKSGYITRGWLRAKIENKPEFEYTYTNKEIPVDIISRIIFLLCGIYCIYLSYFFYKKRKKLLNDELDKKTLEVLSEIEFSKKAKNIFIDNYSDKLKNNKIKKVVKKIDKVKNIFRNSIFLLIISFIYGFGLMGKNIESEEASSGFSNIILFTLFIIGGNILSYFIFYRYSKKRIKRANKIYNEYNML